MKRFTRKFQDGAMMAAGFLVVISLTALVAESIKKFSSGETISSSEINHNFTIAAPNGLIAAFNLSSCPTGWVGADGTNGTPDLRGQFLRGLNDFGTSAGTRADGNQDPDGAARTLGDQQGDVFSNHNHGGGNHRHSVASGWGSYSGLNGGTRAFAAVTGGLNGHIDSGASGQFLSNTSVISSQGGNENRPKNVAIIFCVRMDT